MTHLFEPLTLRGVRLRNRIGMSPMCQYSCQDGLASDWHAVHLGSRAVGGVGLVIAEATAVEARGRISPHDLGLWNDAQIEPLARIARFVEEQGAVAGIQLAHAGRKASTARPWDGGKPLSAAQGGWDIVGPSPLPFGDGYATPHALSKPELAEVRRSFLQSVQRARTAGFRFVELHGAHGYLLHSFLSPLSNQRTDEYGGSFDNRVRFVLELAREVRAAWDGILSLRLSCTDWLEGGWTVEESVELSRQLGAAGVDIVDCSSGGTSAAAVVPLAAGYQVKFATAIKRQAGVATAAVGLITQPSHADAIIQQGEADLVLLGRELLRHPFWPLTAAQSLRREPPKPVQYGRAF
jgi:2,4-dienoyl-CoA reductase-like NADH-dependent reductase (Old Yellow Enzyme family)